MAQGSRAGLGPVGGDAPIRGGRLPEPITSLIRDLERHCRRSRDGLLAI